MIWVTAKVLAVKTLAVFHVWVCRLHFSDVMYKQHILNKSANTEIRQ